MLGEGRATPSTVQPKQLFGEHDGHMRHEALQHVARHRASSAQDRSLVGRLDDHRQAFVEVRSHRLATRARLPVEAGEAKAAGDDEGRQMRPVAPLEPGREPPHGKGKEVREAV